RSTHTDLVRALESTVRDQHRFLLAQQLAPIDFLEEQIATFDTDIVERITPAVTGVPPPIEAPVPVASLPARMTDADHAAAAPPLAWDEAVMLWDEIPGMGRRIA